jgi:broad specificity polyphosphatase/5'/3'-nucleotidase SurE
MPAVVRSIVSMKSGRPSTRSSSESDHQAVADGFISITPLHMDLTSYSVFDTVRAWSLEG